MNDFQQVVGRALTVVVLAALSGCGGGGGDAAPSAPSVSAEGIWSGRITGSSVSDTLLLVVLDDGSYYGVYGDAAASYGLVQGTATTRGNQFISTDGRDFGFGAGVPYGFSLNATVSSRASIGGSATYGPPVSQTVSYSLSYDSSYLTAASLSDAAGTYSGAVGSLLGISNLTLTVDGAGAMSGVTSTGCQVNGTLRPRGLTAVFDLTFALDATTCGQAVTGQGVAGLSGSTRRTLTFAAVNGDRSNAVFGTATRP